MPRLLVQAIPIETVLRASGGIQTRISALLALPPELVTIQVSQDRFVQAGREVPGDPFIEISLFDRGQEKEDEIARIVTEEFQRAGVPALDVYLTRLEKRRYFENGIHF